LFEIESTLSFNADSLVDGDEYDYVTRTSLNQGVLRTTGFVNAENVNDSGCWSLGLLQMDFFYRSKPWYAGQFVRKIIPKIKVSEGAIPFLTTILNQHKTDLLAVLVRNVDKTFRETMVQLPTKDGQIDFDFMESFIAELEARYIAELEVYLTVTGLKDYTLTKEEEKALEDFNTLRWGKYKMGDLYERIDTQKLPYKAKDLPKEPIDNFILPCLTSSFQNQGLNYYAPTKDATVLSNVISIPSNSDVYRAYYQSRAFTVLSDAYAIRWKSDKNEILPNHYLFMVMCINKVTDLPIYSYKNKLGGWNVVKEKFIHLPEKDGKTDFEFMSTFISAIQKLIIKDVVLYADRKIGETKAIVAKKDC